MAGAYTVALLIILLIYGVILLVSIGMMIVQLIAMWKLYEKAGEPGWSAIVPFYNYFKMIKIALGSYKLAWVYLALVGVYMIFAFASAMAGFFFKDSNELEMMRLALMGAAYLMLIPMYVLIGYVNYMFAKSYGKSTALCVLTIFFSGIMIIIFGFDKNTYYVGPKAASRR